MEIKINVDETQFKELLEKNLKALPAEKIQEIIIEGIRNYIQDKSVMRDLIFGQRDSWNNVRVSDAVLKILEKAPLSKSCEQIQEDIVQYLKEHHPILLRDTLAHLLMRQISQSGVVNEAMEYCFREMLSRVHN